VHGFCLAGPVGCAAPSPTSSASQHRLRHRHVQRRRHWYLPTPLCSASLLLSSTLPSRVIYHGSTSIALATWSCTPSEGARLLALSSIGEFGLWVRNAACSRHTATPLRRVRCLVASRSTACRLRHRALRAVVWRRYRAVLTLVFISPSSGRGCYLAPSVTLWARICAVGDALGTSGEYRNYSGKACSVCRP